MEITNVVVLGAGTMGAGIAQVCAQAGYQTHLYDADEGGLNRGLAAIDAFWDKGIAKGKTTAEQKAGWKQNLHGQTTLDVANADLVIEAIPEILELKQKVLGELSAQAPSHAIIATNTSSLSIAKIAAATRDPARVIGLHFFNPVPIMKLLEIVRHPGTADEVLDASQLFGTRIGKTTISVNDMPGFATSRLGIALGNEAARMVEAGVATAADIDTAMKLGYGHPMGPLELSDLVGLDVRHNITKYLHETLGGDQWIAPAITEKLVAAGHLGKKTGKGFYDWTSGRPAPRNLEE